MFITTVSYGPAVSMPRGQDAEQAVNSTGSGEKGSVLLPGSAQGPGNVPRASPRAVPHAGVVLAPLRDVLVHLCSVPTESVKVCLGIPIRKKKELPLQNIPCKIIPGRSPALPQGVSNSALDAGEEPCSSELRDSTAAQPPLTSAPGRAWKC